MPGRSRGFTIIELLIAVAISALLMAVAVPSYEEYARRARLGQAIADLGALDMRIERYMSDNFRPPDSLADLPGDVPADPWGRPYAYLRIEGAGPGVLANVRKDRKQNPINSDYDIFSRGPDGLSQPPLVAAQSQDDVVRAGNGGFIGLAADY